MCQLVQAKLYLYNTSHQGIFSFWHLLNLKQSKIKFILQTSLNYSLFDSFVMTEIECKSQILLLRLRSFIKWHAFYLTWKNEFYWIFIEEKQISIRLYGDTVSFYESSHYYCAQNVQESLNNFQRLFVVYSIISYQANGSFIKDLDNNEAGQLILFTYLPKIRFPINGIFIQNIRPKRKYRSKLSRILCLNYNRNFTQDSKQKSFFLRNKIFLKLTHHINNQISWLKSRIFEN